MLKLIRKIQINTGIKYINITYFANKIRTNDSRHTG